MKFSQGSIEGSADACVSVLRSTISSRCWACIHKGTLYIELTSFDWTTESGATLQKRAIFRRVSPGISFSVRNTRMSGCMPSSCRALTECCVGLVFSSLAAAIKGTYVRWMQRLLLPSSHRSCRTASRNGSDSISPTVPPISVIMKS